MDNQINNDFKNSKEKEEYFDYIIESLSILNKQKIDNNEEEK